MPTLEIHRSCPVKQSARVAQLSGIFDLPPTKKSEEHWTVHMDLPKEWNLGLIVGPSGAGKTTVAAEVFGSAVVSGFDWPEDASVVDAFPKGMSIHDITGLLSSVGFSSPPAWLRPYRVLSNGEKFRVEMARVLAEMPELAVVDEFTSVVDRTVAQFGSAAIAKTVRRRNQRFIGVSCHYDVIPWLQPDWVYEPHTDHLARGCLQQRPPIRIEVRKVDRGVWSMFGRHHYLAAELNKASQCFGGYLEDGTLVAFTSYLNFPHNKVKNIKVGHRLVVLPDYQGVGIGLAMDNWLGQYLHERGFRYRNTCSHPAMIRSYNNSPRWRADGRCKTLQSGPGSRPEWREKQFQPRRLSTWTFEYVPE